MFVPPQTILSCVFWFPKGEIFHKYRTKNLIRTYSTLHRDQNEEKPFVNFICHSYFAGGAAHGFLFLKTNWVCKLNLEFSLFFKSLLFTYTVPQCQILLSNANVLDIFSKWINMYFSDVKTTHLLHHSIVPWHFFLQI